MNFIARHIEYLLTKSDCVAVPSLGAFIVRHEMARYDAKGAEISAPRREVYFNSNISENNDLLINSVARKNAIGYKDASELVDSEVEALKSAIKAGGSVAIGRIGVLQMGGDENIVFMPFEGSVVSDSYFGLCNTELHTLADLRKQGEQNIVEVNWDDNKKKVVFPRWMAYAASIIVILALSVIFTTPLPFDLQNSEFASYFTKNESHQVVDFTANYDKRELYCVIPVEAVSQAAAESVEFSAGEQDLNESIADKYFLVVASLPSQRLADKFIAEDGNADLKVIVCGDKYRIYIASGDSSVNLEKYMKANSIGDKYPGAWVCRR